MKSSEDFQNFKKKLDQVSPSFCIAKWKQVTIHFQTGKTHSCHHPRPHKIPLKEVSKDPSALHNTQYKKKLRRFMLKGKRPSECAYCWNIEDLKSKSLSDRTYKSSTYWASPSLNECAQGSWKKNYFPSYVELSFSNACNLKCSYCSPEISSQWEEEIKKWGHYPTSSKYKLSNIKNKFFDPIIREDVNPYIEAWKKWLPDLMPHLKVLRVTGGEPLLSKNTFELIDYILQSKKKDLEFSVNSNLCVSTPVFNRFLNKFSQLSDTNLKNLEIFTSIDSWGDHAEYIRHGFKTETFVKHTKSLLETIPDLRLVFMCTYNALSPFKFRQLLNFIIGLREAYPQATILIDISYLRSPYHQSIDILQGRANAIMEDDLKFMERNSKTNNPLTGFFPEEIQKMDRTLRVAQNIKKTFKVRRAQKDFFKFFKEHDRRRNTNFFSTFPEFKDFENTKLFEKKEMNSNAKNIQNMNDRMKEVLKLSQTMCTAKWLQSTLHLHNGFTHSCHHPTPHKIPLKELEYPSALHNTKFKKSQRALMLEGKRPKECNYCWNIEDLGPQYYSDRTYKSANEEWSVPFLEKVKQAGAQQNIDPSYLEVSFSNACNFKCVYCSPEVSSKWMEEIKTHGSMKLSKFNMHDLNYLKKTGKVPYGVKEENPYVESFWKWWPQLYKSLNTFRITGGEPLLTKDTWKVFDYIEKNPRKDLSFVINSNLGVTDALIDKLIESTCRVADKVKSFYIYTSLESTHKQAEYTRFGLDYEKFIKNVNRYLSETPCKLHFMVTFNILSLSTFEDFLTTVCSLREKYNQKGSLNRVPMMIAYLRWPEMLDVRVAPKELRQFYAQRYLDFAKKYSAESASGNGFLYLEEINQIERLCEYMLGDTQDLQTKLIDFDKYIKQIDTRRGLNFKNTFPELTDLST